MANIIHITDFNDPGLDIFARLSENQLKHIYEPDYGLFIAESPNVILRAFGAGYEPVSILVEDKHIDGEAKEVIAKCGNIPVYTAPFDVLTKLTGFTLTRGVLCAMKRRPFEKPSDICKNASRIAILEDVVNPTNVGAIFRSAAALGIDAVLLTAACSDPLYRRAARVSMGTVFQIPWTYINASELKASRESCEKTQEYSPIEQVKSMGFKTAALALSDNSVSIDDPSLMSEERLAIVLGTEGAGLKKETIMTCDYTVKIPMYHGVDSLNVAAASAIAFWQLKR